MFEPFTIEKIILKKFYADEYNGPEKKISGKSLFIYGTNNTGKSTSFEAIIYALFGWEFIDRKSSISDTQIILKNNEFQLKIQRKYNSEPLLEIKNISGERAGDKIEIKGNKNIYAKLVEFIGIPESLFMAKKIIAALTIPQSNDNSLLRKYTNKDLDYIISFYSSGYSAINRIREIDKELENKPVGIEKIDFKKLEIEREIEEIKLEEKRNKHFIKELEDFVQQYDSGDILKTVKILNQNENTYEILSKLNSTRAGYYDKKYKIYKEISNCKQFYDVELIDAIKRTLAVLVCPVCGEDLDLNEIEKRKNRGICPFCGSNHSPEDVYEIISEEISKSNKKIDNLKNKIVNIGDNINKIDLEMQEISKQLFIANVNHVLIRNLKLPKSEMTNKYEEYKEKIRKYKVDLAENEKRILNLINYFAELDKESQQIIEDISKLEKESLHLIEEKTKEGIKRFNDELNRNYTKLISPLPYYLELKSGKIILHKNTIQRDCSDKNSLGYSERKLIDFALWVTFISINKIENNINLNFGIIDDIFNIIDNKEIKWLDNLLLMLNNIKDKTQVIVFSVNKDINNELQLDFELPLQFKTNLSDFILESI